MPEYKNGKIYCVRSHKTDLVYVGSTTQPLSKRMADHRSNFKRFNKDQKKYISSYEIVKHGDAYIELLHCCPCNTKEELIREEGKYIREMNCVNKYISGRTRKEYFCDNKKRLIEYQKRYDDEHKEQISLKNKRNYKKRRIYYTCECGSTLFVASKNKHNKSNKHCQYLEENNTN